MKTKILGIILSILGIAGLILALVYMNEAADFKQVSLLFAAGLLGAVVFFAGIKIMPNSNTYNKAIEVRRP